MKCFKRYGVSHYTNPPRLKFSSSITHIPLVFPVYYEKSSVEVFLTNVTRMGSYFIGHQTIFAVLIPGFSELLVLCLSQSGLAR